MTKRRISALILLTLLAGVCALAQTSQSPGAEARLRTELEPQINDAEVKQNVAIEDAVFVKPKK